MSKILLKKPYIKPKLTKVDLDSSISLVMMSAQTPANPKPRGGSSPSSEPFSSPFGDKPFG